MSDENYQGEQNLKEGNSLEIMYLDFFDGSTVGISGAGEVVTRYNESIGFFEASQNGGAFQTL